MSAPQGSSGKEFSGWQTGDGIYLSAGAGNITLADGSSLRGDRIYYIIRRAAPDGKAIIQLADTGRRAARQGAGVRRGEQHRRHPLRPRAHAGGHARQPAAVPRRGRDGGVDSANNRLVVNAPFDGVQEGSAIVYSGSLANGQIENVLANRILRQGQDVLKVGVTYYVVNLDRSVNGQVSFQLRDGQGNLVNFSGATTGGAMQRFSVDNPAGALLNANGSLTLPKAHGLATGDKVVVNLGAQGVLTGLTDNHVYVVEVIDSNTLRFKQVDGSAVTLAQLGYVSEFNAATGRYQYYLADASGNKLLDGQGKPSAVNPDAMIGITRVKLDQQTSQSTTTTKPDGTQQTVISQGPPRTRR